jgi:hypothetical protein
LREVGRKKRPTDGAVYEEKELIGLDIHPCENFPSRAAIIAGVATADHHDVGWEAVQVNGGLAIDNNDVIR